MSAFSFRSGLIHRANVQETERVRPCRLCARLQEAAIWTRSGQEGSDFSYNNRHAQWRRGSQHDYSILAMLSYGCRVFEDIMV